MPILNREDAADVDEQITRIFAASDGQRPNELRRLFVEKLDFSPTTGSVSLSKARKGVSLPEGAERLATMTGVTAVYIAIDDDSTNRVRKAEATAAANSPGSMLDSMPMASLGPTPDTPIRRLKTAFSSSVKNPKSSIPLSFMWV